MHDRTASIGNHGRGEIQYFPMFTGALRKSAALETSVEVATWIQPVVLEREAQRIPGGGLSSGNLGRRFKVLLPRADQPAS